jgi:hypothetical protein
MSDEIELTRRLVFALRECSTPSKTVSGFKEFGRRCIFCGDSDNHTHYHMYIELKLPYRFFCQKCNMSGVVSGEFLENCGVTDSSVIAEINEINKDAKFKRYSHIESKHNPLSVLLKRKVSIPPFIKTEESMEKVNYLKSRLFLDEFNIGLLKSFKVITDLDYFFEHNDFTDLPKSVFNETHYNNLCKYYVGFLSYDNNFVVLRRLETAPTTLDRFYSINLFDIEEAESGFYAISKDIDIMTPKLKLVMAEGFFSLIGGLRLNGLDELKDTSTVYATPMGKSFKKVIKNFIALGFLNMEIEIFSDPDLDARFYKKLFRSIPLLRQLDIKMTVYWNALEKDFGEECITKFNTAIITKDNA